MAGEAVIQRPGDVALSDTARSFAAHHRLYRHWYAAGRLTPHDATALEATCATYALRLTPAQQARDPLTL